jgi:hypothetical protein
MDFVESVAVCLRLLRTKTRQSKKFWGTSTCKSKVTERAVPSYMKSCVCMYKNSLNIQNELQWFRRVVAHD